jgi:hypothetical protein
VLSYFLVGAAAIAGGVSIYTWRTYSGEQDEARQALDVLQLRLPDASPAVTEFFSSSAQLSSCQPPPELTVRAMADPVTITAYNNYLEHCRRGRSFAGASTGLVAAMGSLALLGVTSYILGDRIRAKGKREGTSQAQASKSWLYTPRLTVISPQVSTTGGGMSLSFQF